MQITIDTHNLSDLDVQILQVLLGGDVTNFPTDVVDEVYAGTDEDGEDVYEEEPEAAPKKAPAKKAAATPEPMAEEPVEEEPAEDEVDDGVSDEDLLALAVKKATEMVAGGEAAKVREALDAAGASRVRELNADNVRDFFGALS